MKLSKPMFSWRLSGLLLWVLPVVIGLGTLSCTRRDRSAKFALQVQLANEPVSLDPSLAEDGVSMRVLSNLMEGLYCQDGYGKLHPCMAESYQVSKDGKRYVFTLRTEAAWSDSVKVTAKDFVTGIRRSLAPKTSGKLASLLFPIRGARAFHAGEIPPEKLGVSEADGKVVIELEHPVSYFLEILSLPMAGPYREDMSETLTTGPYKVAHHVPGDHLLLASNEYYWERFKEGKQANRPVMLRIVSDASTALNLLKSGKLDIITQVPSLDFERLKAEGRLTTSPFLATYYLAFNTRKPPFNSRQARRAVSGAIDREGLVAALGTGERPARSWIPEPLEGAIPYSDPRPIFAASLAKVHAKQIKAPSAGSLALSFDGNPRNITVAEKVQSDLKKALGYRVSLQSMDWKSYVKQLETDPAPIYRFGWLAAFRDPISHLEVFTTGNPNNYTGWSNAEYDRLVDQIRRVPSGSKRVALIHKAQKIIVDRDAVVVPLYHYVQTHAVSDRIANFHVSPFGVIRFDEITMKAKPKKPE